MKTLFSKFAGNQTGTSMVEISVSLGLMAVGALALASMGGSNGAQVNALEYRLLREQYKMQTMTQFLSNPNNCKCLFKDKKITKRPTATIVDAADANGNKLGFFKEDCSAVTAPFLTDEFSTDGVRLKHIKLMDVEYTNGSYLGNFSVMTESRKDKTGNEAPDFFKRRGFKLPVILKTADAPEADKVLIEGCTTANSSNQSPFKLPDSSGAGWKINPLANNTVRDFTFSSLPASAQGVFIQYTIGSPSNGRSDRNCDIMGRDINVKLGTDSKGDGGQRFVAGSAYVPLDGCTTPMKYRCSNKSGRGEFKVVAYIDDGNAPNCGGTLVDCPSGQLPDGVGGCVVPEDESGACATGYMYDEPSDKCVEDPSWTCPAGQTKVGPGACFDPASVTF